MKTIRKCNGMSRQTAMKNYCRFKKEVNDGKIS